MWKGHRQISTISHVLQAMINSQGEEKLFARYLYKRTSENVDERISFPSKNKLIGLRNVDGESDSGSQIQYKSDALIHHPWTLASRPDSD